MRIQHNIMAMNAYRNYNNNTSAVAKNLEKLSSGYKINRAGDDAAGLAISEKMRAQITGLETAQKNVKDGISLVKTAEGAMQEIHDMLNRMEELAVQSANGTYDNEVDRLNLQKEVTALKSEINRIADSANFNGIKLLNGDRAAPVTTTETVIEGADAMTDLTGKLPTAGTAIGTNTVVYQKGVDAVKTKFEVDLSDLKWTADAANDTLTIGVGNYSLQLKATAAGEQDIGALLTAAFATDVTGKVNTGKGDFNITYDAGKLTFELAAAPDAATDAADLNPNYAVTVTPSAGTTSGTQWNSGTTVLQTGVKKVDDTLANTVVQQADLTGFDTTDATKNDGFAIEIDGQKYVLAVGDDSQFAKVSNDGYTVVKVSDSATANDQIKALANAIEAGSATWSAGMNANGDLTLAQRPGTDGSGLTTVANIEKSIKIGKLTATETTTTTNATGKPLQLQIGDTSDDYNQLKVSIGSMYTKDMVHKNEETGETTSIADIDIGNQDGASDAVDVIKNAINYVSGVRGDLGAIQNRLEHTANNLSVMTENIQDAESTIRDTDVAEEMMAYTKNNILVQSAQAMLAQANQIPQGVLQLLG